MKNEKVEALLQKLEQGVAGVYNSETWKQVLLLQSKFHSYSFNNVLLILLQAPHATRVAGFNTWKDLGRNVKKGEKAIQILAPLIKNFEVKDEGSEEPDAKKTVRKLYGFRLVNVFDASQTEGKPLPAAKLASELRGNSEAAAVLIETLQNIIEIPVAFEDIQDGSKGYYSRTDHRIAIKEGMAADQTAKTMIHEYVHSLLHHKDAADLNGKSRGQREAEAEGTAFVVASYFGLDTSEYSFGYVASWAKRDNGVELIKAIGQTIQQTASKIIDQIETFFQNIEQMTA